MTPQEFVAKWRGVTLKERSASQSHFNDLCALIGHRNPIEDDPTGERFTFEKGADKQSGGQGWADVWKRDYFAWEYKGKHANLKKAYDQLLLYRESLLNPPLLVVSDLDSIVVHTNFTNTAKRTVAITLDDLLTPDGLRNLRAVFTHPEHFKAPQTTEQVTKQAAAEFALLADNLRKRYESPEVIAHFLIRVLFCLFSEDIELLPKGLFSRLIDLGRRNPAAFVGTIRQLFQSMATSGYFGVEPIRHFNGGLFDNDAALDLDHDGLTILYRVAQLDWSSIEPSIFGTLFQRSLDPSKRSQLGAHYTSQEDILLIVEPVLMAPLRREWEVVKVKATELAARRDNAANQGTRTRLNNELGSLIGAFLERLSTIRVLDPACGSGNFLYMAMRCLLDLWKEVSNFASTLGLPLMLTTSAPSPEQLFGIEIDAYAHELAQATVWIGYIQWLHENGYGIPSEPILRKLDNIKHMDAILAYDADGKPVEPEWPEADVIVGNPPFLGDKKMRAELGELYVKNVRMLYGGRIPGQSDLVCYWFEKARHYIENHSTHRAGLLSTQAIRGGANRTVLDRVKRTGNIFWAYSDKNWVLDGAVVHVSMIGFDGGKTQHYQLDGKSVKEIHSDLTSSTDLTKAEQLSENRSLAFIGTQKGGKFDISQEQALLMISAKGNPTGKSNADVVRPWVNGLDLVQRPRNMYIIDFGSGLSAESASLYELPFEYARQHIKPQREKSFSEARTTEQWWLHQRPRPEMRAALVGFQRYIGTPRVAKHRVFIWLSADTLADSQVVVFARQDDYFLGLLQSHVHESWARSTGTQLREAESGFRYSQTMTFETFPFPWPPGSEPTADPRVQAIAQAAKELVEKRDNWLNPSGATEAQLKKLTLTNLYNQRPTWLDLAHKKLDAAVLAAYGWSDLMTPDGIADEETLLSRLLALNLDRAARQGEVQPALIEEEIEDE